MENKISTGTLATYLSRNTGKSKKLCEDFLREFFRLATETLEAGETLKVKGFGTFKVSEVEKRESVNVVNGERQEIGAYKKVVFTPSKELAAAINEPFQDFESIEIEDDMPEDFFFENPGEEKITEESKEEEESAVESIEKESGKGIDSEPEGGISDENEVTSGIIEAGSVEENQDDDITLEAYNLKEEEEQDKDISNEVSRSRFWMGILIGSLSMFAACLVIFIIGCFNDWWPENIERVKTLTKQKEQVAEEVAVPEEKLYLPEEESEIQVEEPVYDTVSTTRYLTTIAREHYGDFNFWPYIYIENESILGHPDRIVPGTQVVVPDLKKYGVEVTNSEDVAQAKKLGREIYAKYRK